MSMTAAVAQAIEDLKTRFPDATVTATETGDGGAWVRLDPISLGDAYLQEETWVAFQLTFAYPDADVYPHFIRPDLERRDGKPLGQGFSVRTFGPTATRAVQISRRSPETLRNDATVKLLKVIEWVGTR